MEPIIPGQTEEEKTGNVVRASIRDSIDKRLGYPCVMPAKRRQVQTKPNDPCPCKSGKKFKKCCNRKR